METNNNDVVYVKCKWCKKIYPEHNIIYNENDKSESCPYCDSCGYELFELNGKPNNSKI